MAKYSSAIRASVRQFLRDEFSTGQDFEWKDDELDIYIGNCLAEISDHSPYKFKEVLTTIANSRVLDISDIEDLIEIEKLEYPTGSSPRKLRNFVELDSGQIEIDCTLNPSAGGSGTLTGTVTFTKGSAAITGSGTDFDGELKAGYHIKKSTGTRWYRIYSIESDTALTLAEPSSDTGADTEKKTEYCYETVYVYCDKTHQVTESSSTLNPKEESALIRGVVAYATLGWLNNIRIQITAALSDISDADTAFGSMSARITQAIADLTSGRAIIGAKRDEAIAAIGNMSARLTQAMGDLTSGRAIIGDKRAEAISAIDSMTSYITQAINDLTSGRSQVADTRTLADAAIDSMSARITQAMDDLTSGRALINKVNIGGRPETDYANYAARELSNAVEYLNQARGYLSEAVTSDRYANYAARDLQIVTSYLNQARGYLATDSPSAEYAGYATRELSNAMTYLNQARGYLGLDSEARDYGNYAARELNNATGYLNQASGYLREVTARLNITGSMTRYQNWANNQLALFKEGLKGLAKPRVYQKYPKGG